ncbi:MAG TPA: hypothetical protein VF784_12470 [Anaerolineales bacterium]
MDFGEVLSSAWRIIWKHKVLWIFGIFAGCSRGGGGGGNGGSQVTSRGGPNPFPGFNEFATQFGNWINSHLWVVVLFILVVLVLFLLALFLGTIGRIGLIRGTFKADGGAEHLGFMELWDESLPYFWRIFLLALLVGLAAFFLVLALVAVGIGAAVFTFGIGFLCVLPLFCVLFLALVFAGIVIQQAESAIVIENLGIMDGVRRGWDVVKTHLGPILIMWLILLVIGFVVGIVLALPILIVLVPAAIAFGTANYQATTFDYTPLIVGLVCCAVYFPFLLVLGGILQAYLQSAWTLTFLRLTRPKVTPVPESTVIPAPNA